VVNAAAAGESDGVKEYAIGVEVFERGNDFDPRVDPIVRVQASKLRSKLTEYYSAHGAADPLIIAIPKGSYSATFELRTFKLQTREEHDHSSIAVLPFVNMSADTDNEYFSDGLTEEVINALTTIRGLHVVARTSVFHFKGQNQDIREIGKRLNAASILEGSVRKSGSQLRITAQLIDVADGYHLWSNTFKRELQDIFAVQEEISEAVRAALAPYFEGRSSRPVTAIVTPKHHKPNPQAHELYMRGRYAQARMIHGSIQQGIQLFEEAIAADPLYARAYAGLADAWFLLAFWGVVPPHFAMPKAKAAALKALELDDHLPEAHASLGVIQTSYEWDWSKGEQSLRRALELDPDLINGIQAFASQVHLPAGRLAEAIELQKQVIALDPLAPNPQATLTFMLGTNGQLDEAVAQHEIAMATNPMYFFAHGTMALAYSSNGRTAEAVEEMKLAYQGSHGHPGLLAGLAYFHAVDGRKEEALTYLQQAHAASESICISAFDFAGAYAGFGDREQTLTWLEKACEERAAHLFVVAIDPRFRWLHNDPQFHDLLQRMGLRLPRR
jgi:adenylate cyclase